jgi:hypothetical protein
MSDKSCTILFVGDVVGGLGKRTLLGLLPSLRERVGYDFLVVNGENIAGGVGITPKLADQLFAAGVDVITLGNHTYRQREIYPEAPAGPWLVRGGARGCEARCRLAVGQSVHGRGPAVVRRGRRGHARPA